jgi:hypothetical protein
MSKFNLMKSEMTNEFSRLSEEALVLVIGGSSQSIAATGSCGTTGSSKDCDHTAVCTCCGGPIHP